MFTYASILTRGIMLISIIFNHHFDVTIFISDNQPSVCTFFKIIDIVLKFCVLYYL